VFASDMIKQGTKFTVVNFSDDGDWSTWTFEVLRVSHDYDPCDGASCYGVVKSGDMSYNSTYKTKDLCDFVNQGKYWSVEGGQPSSYLRDYIQQHGSV
jgi:hypothetical protein